MSAISEPITEEFCSILEPYSLDNEDIDLLDMSTWEKEDLKRIKSLIDCILTERQYA